MSSSSPRPADTSINISPTSIDLALSSLTAQIASLERRKTQLSAKLQCLRPMHVMLYPPRDLEDSRTFQDTPTSSPTVADPMEGIPLVSDDEILAFALTGGATKESRNAIATRLYRMSGITTFAIQDPSPAAEKLLAVRIEVFSDGRFHAPHYLLFSASTPKSPFEAAARLTLTRHTLPAYIPIFSILRRHPLSSTGGLSKFIKAVRRHLILHRRRVDAVQRLQALALNAGQPGNVEELWTNRVDSVEWDPAVEVVAIYWSNGTKGWVRVKEDGIVRGAIVRDARGKRRGRVEKAFKGSLEGMGERLGWERELEEEDESEGSGEMSMAE
ncbi:hypothetical protein RUND412_001608 [Rhizina undulata]